MRRHTILFATALTAAVLAQEPAPRSVYSYEGKPLKLDFTCKEEDTTTFGLTCSIDEPCDVFLELSAVEMMGNRLFLTGNLHTSNVTLWSILLMSEDGGKTWSESYERMRSTGLEQIQFLGLEVGWIGGQQLLSLPRDPFLLVTGDGGKTWRKKPVYSETRVGAIEQFSFENPKDGAMLIDRTQSGDSGGRHEYYESNTGGDSWSLRQVSPKPIKLKRPHVANENWRVRADGPTKSFRIEHRSAQRWQTAASFLIKVGDCQPQELKLAEPPPLEAEQEKKPEAGGVFVVPSAPSKKKRRP
ncbi:MAG TPA: hypothetical protein VM120_14990 [Bryobacteraceae bacterium]|nr:hypothetical protein [Bryobacteraceae bacterium]